MNSGGLCESCMKPGACCEDLSLYGGRAEQRIDAPMSADRAEHLALSYGLPFRPAYQQADGTWRWWCTSLDKSTGRCTTYETRPQLCRDYAPGTDELCVHHTPKEALP